jgi:hypothetical protein
MLLVETVLEAEAHSNEDYRTIQFARKLECHRTEPKMRLLDFRPLSQPPRQQTVPIPLAISCETQLHGIDDA